MRKLRATSVTLLSALVVASAATAGLVAPANAAGCLGSGTDATINAALKGAGAQAILCPGAVFALSNPVTFTAANQVIETQGLPTGSTRAVLRIASSAISSAVVANNQSGVVVQNIQADGQLSTYGRSSGGALLEMGGNVTGQVVQNVYAHDTRSWSTLHIIEGHVVNNTPTCQNAKILNNTIGPAGTSSPTNTWADGISLACGNTLVQGNTVTDATDGGIVVFGAPGSTVKGNTVVAQNRILLGGINMVDYAPTNGNFTGTVVTGNTIDAAGALIKVGLAMGPHAWTCSADVNYGASVTNNTLEGKHMGYGYAVNGVRGFTVTGNVDNSTHTGTVGAGCGGTPDPPAGFQYQAVTASTLQAQFKQANLIFQLGLH